MGFTRNGPPRAGMISLPEHAFDQLEQFILSNRDTNSGAEPLELMSLSARPGSGKIITAKNYVGVITTKDGTEIEILPKLTLTGDNSDQAVRKVFLTMLRTVQEAPFKTFRTAHLNTSRMRLLDLFVRMFLDEAHRLIQCGLKSDYTVKQDNEACVRGKIVFSEHIRKNLLHRERIFVEYDVFSVELPGKSPGQVHSALLAAAHHGFTKPQGSADRVIRHGASSGVQKCGAGFSEMWAIPLHGRLPATSGAVPGIFAGKEFYRLFRRAGGLGPSVPHGADF